MGVVLRWLGAFVLLALTYNPTPWNFVTWSQANFADQMPLTLLLGLMLGLGYLLYLTATFRSIGILGIVATKELIIN